MIAINNQPFCIFKNDESNQMIAMLIEDMMERPSIPQSHIITNNMIACHYDMTEPNTNDTYRSKKEQKRLTIFGGGILFCTTNIHIQEGIILANDSGDTEHQLYEYHTEGTLFIEEDGATQSYSIYGDLEAHRYHTTEKQFSGNITEQLITVYTNQENDVYETTTFTTTQQVGSKLYNTEYQKRLKQKYHDIRKIVRQNDQKKSMSVDAMLFNIYTSPTLQEQSTSLMRNTQQGNISYISTKKLNNTNKLTERYRSTCDIQNEQVSIPKFLIEKGFGYPNLDEQTIADKVLTKLKPLL